MEAQTWKKVKALAWALGLAAALTALLLVWAAERAPATKAMAGSSPGASAEPGTPGFAGATVRFGDVAPGWVVTEPRSVYVPNDMIVYWDLRPTYNIVITIPTTAFNHEEGANFTFTPRTDLRLDSSWASLPYFFDLKGVFVGEPGEVSLKADVTISVGYEEEDLEDILPESLEALWQDLLYEEWDPLGASVNTSSRRVTWKTQLSGAFGIGGRRRTLLYLPTIRR